MLCAGGQGNGTNKVGDAVCEYDLQEVINTSFRVIAVGLLLLRRMVSISWRESLAMDFPNTITSRWYWNITNFFCKIMFQRLSLMCIPVSPTSFPGSTQPSSTMEGFLRVTSLSLTCRLLVSVIHVFLFGNLINDICRWSLYNSSVFGNVPDWWKRP